MLEERAIESCVVRHDHPASEPVQHLTQDFTEAGCISNIPASDAMHFGRSKITIRPEQAAPQLIDLATFIDRRKGYLNDPVMGVGVKPGRLAVDDGKGTIYWRHLSHISVDAAAAGRVLVRLGRDKQRGQLGAASNGVEGLLRNREASGHVRALGRDVRDLRQIDFTLDTELPGEVVQ
jgi:hypothetical protein